MSKNKEPIIHSYLTEGFFEWGKMFLRSLKKYNKQKYHVVLDTRGLETDKLYELQEIYNNLTINSENFLYDDIAKEFGINGEQLKKIQKKVEARKTKVTVDKLQMWWKQFISVDDRYNRSIHNVLHNFDCPVLHVDIDTYFRNKIHNIMNILLSNDVSLVFRLHSRKPERKIFGTIVGINNTEKGRRFHDNWKKRIENNPITKRKHNFGQLSLYWVYDKLKKELDWGDFNNKKISRKQNDNNALLWTANKGSKADSLKKCYEDFNG